MDENKVIDENHLFTKSITTFEKNEFPKSPLEDSICYYYILNNLAIN